MQVGHLVNYFIVKAMPDYDSYLTCINGGELLALLPKKYTGREYKVGETGWAAVFDIQEGRITLSQKSPQFIRKILEYLLRDFLKIHDIKIKKIAQTNGALFCKVAVETTMTQKELMKLFKTNRPKDMRDYIPATITPVKYSTDEEEYIMNALSPAPKDEIIKVILLNGMRRATVYVKAELLGFFLGARGQNAAGAAKLTGVEIQINGV